MDTRPQPTSRAHRDQPSATPRAPAAAGTSRSPTGARATREASRPRAPGPWPDRPSLPHARGSPNAPPRPGAGGRGNAMLTGAAGVSRGLRGRRLSRRLRLAADAARRLHLGREKRPAAVEPRPDRADGAPDRVSGIKVAQLLQV